MTAALLCYDIGHLNIVEMDVSAHISPYHVNENYIPPRPVVTATESSDHGYSTMTAHEEIESSSSTSCRDSLVSVARPQPRRQQQSAAALLVSVVWRFELLVMGCCF